MIKAAYSIFFLIIKSVNSLWIFEFEAKMFFFNGASLSGSKKSINPPASFKMIMPAAISQ